MAQINYPFTAILGQERLKTALILNLINPRIGGVLITGQKGTAKSTAVRALGALTEKKVITVPLSVSEDRLIGSVDLEKTMALGRTVFLPGILNEADGQILYVDEVNLLSDHITDMILCAHSNRENRVEREGVSATSACHFLLVGTMNPEEGQLRQHFLDQFGLCVVIGSENKPEDRVSIVKARMAYEQDTMAFFQSFRASETALKQKIKDAAALLPEVTVTEANRLYMVSKCLEAGVQGHRGDLVLEETAKAVAAFDLRTEITDADINEAAKFALLHRRRNSPEEQEEHPPEQQETENQPENDQSQPQERQNPNSAARENQRQGHGKEQNFGVGQAFKVTGFGHTASRQCHKGFGKRTNAKSASKMGRYIYAAQQNRTGDLALDATIRAAAPHQLSREKNGLAIAIREADIREKVRQRKYSNLLVFVVDASGSMGASQRMTETKGAILSLLKDAYIKRDKICLIAFRGQEAQVLLPPTRSVERGVRLLETMTVGGKTPLNAGLAKGLQVVRSELRKNPEVLPYMIMITDGKGNVSINKEKKPKQELMEISSQLRQFPYLNTMVLDIERGGAMRFGLAKEMARRMGASYQKIETLKSAAIVSAIERVR